MAAKIISRWFVFALGLALPVCGLCDPMRLGVQTHFSQDWPVGLMTKVQSLGLDLIRDSLPWAKVEVSPGQDAPPPGLTAYMRAAQADGIGVMLTFAHRNPLYDDGNTPYTAEGTAAYAAYVVRTLKQWPGVIHAVEVGNEVNGNFVKGPATEDRAGSYVRLLRAVHDAVKAYDPKMQVIGGATHSIPIGFFREIFDLGALDLMDGIAIHPYRPVPEHVDTEIASLNDLMSSYGQPLPIYATEFSVDPGGDNTPADYMAKMLAMMSASGVREAYWYALMEQPNYPGLGLFAANGAELPAATAYRFLAGLLKSAGRLKSVSGDPLLHDYVSEDGKLRILWGAPRSITLGDGITGMTTAGEPIADLRGIGPRPVVIIGTGAPVLGATATIGDATYQYGGPPWSYFLMDPDGSRVPLTRIDWNWTSYLGDRFHKPLRVNADDLVPGSVGDKPVEVIEAFTSPCDCAVEVKGDWAVNPRTSEGIDLSIWLNGTALVKEATGTHLVEKLRVDLRTGDQLEFRVGPGTTVKGDDVVRRITIAKEEPS